MAAYNPYGAPTAQGSQWAPQGGPQGEPQPWEATEVVGRAWDVVKTHWVPLVFGALIANGAASMPQQLGNFYRVLALRGHHDFEDPFYLVLLIGGALVGMFVQAFFHTGLVRMYLAAGRGAAPELSAVFSGGSRYLSMLGAMFLYNIIVGIGMLFLLVPGVILALGLGMYPYFVVDREMGAVDALRASWEATTGHKGNLFLLGLYSFGIILLGFVACCVGFLPALAVVSVAHAIVFTCLTGTTGAPPTAYAYGSPPVGPPGGGYGAPPGGYGVPPTGGYGAPGGWGPPPGGYGPPPGGFGQPR